MSEQACRSGRTLFQLLAMMPMAVPGLVLGLAYIVLAQRLPQYRCHPQRSARASTYANSAGISFNQVSSARLSAILAVCTLPHAASHLLPSRSRAVHGRGPGAVDVAKWPGPHRLDGRRRIGRQTGGDWDRVCSPGHGRFDVDESLSAGCRAAARLHGPPPGDRAPATGYRGPASRRSTGPPSRIPLRAARQWQDRASAMAGQSAETEWQ